jgi:CDP-paratose 2-epimerase
MSVVIVTGSAGLIGSESVRAFHADGHEVVGIDNDMRARFFGAEASTAGKRGELESDLARYTHEAVDIRDAEAIDGLFRKYGTDIAAVIHTAAQPSHDWAAKEPLTDFGVNALGTLHLLEACRLHAPEAAFVFTSTNKVYGDTPNRLPLHETATRWEIDADHAYADGIDETMSIDDCRHSLFGASKLSADILVQEYGQ